MAGRAANVAGGTVNTAGGTMNQVEGERIRGEGGESVRKGKGESGQEGGGERLPERKERPTLGRMYGLYRLQGLLAFVVPLACLASYYAAYGATGDSSDVDMVLAMALTMLIGQTAAWIASVIKARRIGVLGLGRPDGRLPCRLLRLRVPRRCLPSLRHEALSRARTRPRRDSSSHRSGHGRFASCGGRFRAGE